MNRKGATAVEFAIVAPLFFLLVLAMITIGRLLMMQSQLHTASFLASRAASLEYATDATVRDAAKPALAGVKFSIERAKVIVAGDEYAKVTISASTKNNAWLPMPEMVLTASSQTRLEVQRVRN